MFYNIIDADAAHQKITKFTQPSFLLSTSLGHIHSKSLPAAYRPNKESNFLLISQDAAVTMFHQDFSSTSVLYILLKGCKTFFLIAPPMELTSFSRIIFVWPLIPSRQNAFRKQSSLNATLLSRSLRLLILCLEYSESFNIFESLTSC